MVHTEEPEPALCMRILLYAGSERSQQRRRTGFRFKENNIEVNQKVYDCFTTEMEDFDKTSFYTIGAFDNSYSARKILDYSL